MITGLFEGTLLLGDKTITSHGNRDIFVTKLDPKGKVLWADGFGDHDHDQGKAVAIDGDGNPVVTGIFRFSFDAVSAAPRVGPRRGRQAAQARRHRHRIGALARFRGCEFRAGPKKRPWSRKNASSGSRRATTGVKEVVLRGGFGMAKAKKGKATARKAKAVTEQLLVASKVKAAMKDAGCNTSGDALEGLNNWVGWLISQATQRAAANGRKTVRAHDFMM